jgi:hypothetical protein
MYAITGRIKAKRVHGGMHMLAFLEGGIIPAWHFRLYLRTGEREP